jgi:hypothetical protein
MKEKLRFLGLDVHADTIAVEVAEPGNDSEPRGVYPQVSPAQWTFRNAWSTVRLQGIASERPFE